MVIFFQTFLFVRKSSKNKIIIFKTKKKEHRIRFQAKASEGDDNLLQPDGKNSETIKSVLFWIFFFVDGKKMFLNPNSKTKAGTFLPKLNLLADSPNYEHPSMARAAGSHMLLLMRLLLDCYNGIKKTERKGDHENVLPGITDWGRFRPLLAPWIPRRRKLKVCLLKKKCPFRPLSKYVDWNEDLKRIGVRF